MLTVLAPGSWHRDAFIFQEQGRLHVRLHHPCNFQMRQITVISTYRDGPAVDWVDLRTSPGVNEGKIVLDSRHD